MTITASHGLDGTAVTQGADPRSDNRQRSISLSRDCVRIDRQVRGIAMRVAVPVRAYRGVALSLRSNADGLLNYQLDLLHADEELSVTLDCAGDDADIVADWRLWSRFFRLPALVEREAGLVEAAEPTLGDLTLGRHGGHRRPSRSRFKRRPLFLQRRRVPAIAGDPVVHAGEREIIARS